jgi:four helix bundle protein
VGRLLEKTAFENLHIYQLAEELSDLAWQTVQNWGFFEKDTIGKQLVRAADSIGANIAGSAP